MPASRTYIFAGGGTGGHLFPGVAVAEQLRDLDPSARILFVGSDKQLELSIFNRLQLEHRSLPVESLQSLTRHPFRFVARNWKAWRIARQWIRELQPAVVVGLGGYASAPIVWAASRVRIPVALLEQNVIPGRTTRLLSGASKLVCTSFAEATRHLSHGTSIEVTGNPVRHEIARLHQARPDRHGKELLILGGSQGADRLNDAVIGAVSALRNDLVEWHIVHQSGLRQIESLRTSYRELQLKATVEPFFDDMQIRYQSASVVISRAGATTLAELTCCGLPMILVPFPQAADDHQRANAIALRDHQAAVVVEHQPAAADTVKLLSDQLATLVARPDMRQSLSDAAYRIAKPDAAAVVAQRIRSFAAPE